VSAFCFFAKKFLRGRFLFFQNFTVGALAERSCRTFSRASYISLVVFGMGGGGHY
jgi:hypothetical protein